MLSSARFFYQKIQAYASTLHLFDRRSLTFHGSRLRFDFPSLELYLALTTKWPCLRFEPPTPLGSHPGVQQYPCQQRRNWCLRMNASEKKAHQLQTKVKDSRLLTSGSGDPFSTAAADALWASRHARSFYPSRGATRSDGARGKKQVWRPPCSKWGLSEASALYRREYLWHCWDFSVPGELRPLTPPRYATASEADASDEHEVRFNLFGACVCRVII